MPYFVHLKDTEPTDENTRYESRADAYRAIPDGHMVTFKISDSERYEWKHREYLRFRDRIYTLPPWIEALYHCWEPSDGEQVQYRYVKLAMHFAHISLKTPGCIAYTPSDEHGYQDRQATIKVGRYLEEHAREYFTQEQINSFVDSVKGYSADLQLATTAEDIYTVYRNSHRGSLASCMSHPTEDYKTGGIHPTAVYGDSDLALAYLGTIEAPTARCIVWPAKKRYTRIYGDTTIKAVMERAGYSYKDGGNNGDLDGAKIRAIKVPGRSSVYVMPYVDAACSADLSDDGEYFILRDDDEGTYDVHNSDYIDGITHEMRNRHSCEHCGEGCDEDESYCSSCDDERISCERCNDTHFDSSDGSWINDNWYCDYCVSHHYTHECEGCGRGWEEVEPDSAYCSRCVDHYRECDDCSEMFDTRGCNDPAHEHCDDCYVEPAEDCDEDDTATSEVAITVSPALPCEDKYPTIDDTISVHFEQGPQPVNVLVLYGAIAVHEKAEHGSGYPSFTLTHVLTGLIVTRETSYSVALDLARLLSTPGIDWGFTEQHKVPSSTREIARYIARNRALPLGDCIASQLLRSVNPSLFATEDVCAPF